MSKQTFAKRCKMFEQCLPDATYRDLLTALHAEMLEALAEQPAQQEPFGYFRYDIQLDAWVKNKEANVGVAFYTEPPKREWVELTDKEIFKLYMGSGCTDIEDCESFEKVVKVVEAKLKEKNK